MLEGGQTSEAQVVAFEAVEPRLRALRRSLEPHIARHPLAPVPRDTLVLARTVLSDIRRVVSREGGPGLAPLHGTPSMLELDARLDLAGTALSVFEKRYKVYDERKDDDVWQIAANRLLEQLEKLDKTL